MSRTIVLQLRQPLILEYAQRVVDEVCGAGQATVERRGVGMIGVAIGDDLDAEQLPAGEEGLDTILAARLNADVCYIESSMLGPSREDALAEMAEQWSDILRNASDGAIRKYADTKVRPDSCGEIIISEGGDG